MFKKINTILENSSFNRVSRVVDSEGGIKPAYNIKEKKQIIQENVDGDENKKIISYWLSLDYSLSDSQGVILSLSITYRGVYLTDIINPSDLEECLAIFANSDLYESIRLVSSQFLHFSAFASDYVPKQIDFMDRYRNAKENSKDQGSPLSADASDAEEPSAVDQ
jgi:hypothetical protein